MHQAVLPNTHILLTEVSNLYLDPNVSIVYCWLFSFSLLGRPAVPIIFLDDLLMLKSCNLGSLGILYLSRSKKVDLIYFIFLFIFYFLFYFLFFRTTRVRVDQSRRYISHLIAKSQNRSRDLEEFSRRFKNK